MGQGRIVVFLLWLEMGSFSLESGENTKNTLITLGNHTRYVDFVHPN